MRLTDEMVQVAAEMHRGNVLVYPQRLSFAPLASETRGRLKNIGEDLADGAADRVLYHPFVRWGWDERIGTDEFEGKDSDLVHMRDRLGPVTPFLTPGLPWLWAYLSAPRKVHGRAYFLVGPHRARESRAAELVGGNPPPVLADEATREAVQDCIRVARDRMTRRTKANEPWELTAWKRRF